MELLDKMIGYAGTVGYLEIMTATGKYNRDVDMFSRSHAHQAVKQRRGTKSRGAR